MLHCSRLIFNIFRENKTKPFFQLVGQIMLIFSTADRFHLVFTSSSHAKNFENCEFDSYFKQVSVKIVELTLFFFYFFLFFSIVEVHIYNSYKLIAINENLRKSKTFARNWTNIYIFRQTILYFDLVRSLF